MGNFDKYRFKDETLKFLELNKFKDFFPIQEKMIPEIISGNDVIGISATGSGKTHAFLTPLMEIVDTNNQNVQAVICAPTRELAQQLFNNAKLMMKANPDLRIKLISGGTNKDRVMESLKIQPHIVIGTPGRIKDLFLNEESLLVQNAKVMIVDEGDMTLEYGFLSDIDAIAGKMKNNLQMIVTSATIPQGLKPFLKKYMTNPTTIKIDSKSEYNPQIEHVLIPCKHKSYAERLLDILPAFNPYMCLIFANSREEADEANDLLKENGYRTLEIHGGLSARERKQALNALVNHDYVYVVATDIAARGIDNDYITHVISLGFPQDLNFYVHRSGRTGRAGKQGTCFAFYKEDDDKSIKLLKEKGVKFEHRNVKNGQWQDLKPYGFVRKKQNTELEKEISMIVKKPSKVKPGYKKKREEEIEKLKRRKKREFIKSEINKQKKERAKAKQREKYGK